MHARENSAMVWILNVFQRSCIEGLIVSLCHYREEQETLVGGAKERKFFGRHDLKEDVRIPSLLLSLFCYLCPMSKKDCAIIFCLPLNQKIIEPMTHSPKHLKL